jgi:hypothetical protein
MQQTGVFANLDFFVAQEAKQEFPTIFHSLLLINVLKALHF